MVARLDNASRRNASRSMSTSTSTQPGAEPRLGRIVSGAWDVLLHHPKTRSDVRIPIPNAVFLRAAFLSGIFTLYYHGRARNAQALFVDHVVNLRYWSRLCLSRLGLGLSRIKTSLIPALEENKKLGEVDSWSFYIETYDEKGPLAKWQSFPGGPALQLAAQDYALLTDDYDVSLKDVVDSGLWPYNTFPPDTSFEDRLYGFKSFQCGYWDPNTKQPLGPSSSRWSLMRPSSMLITLLSVLLVSSAMVVVSSVVFRISALSDTVAVDPVA
jgi:hypothetical protein